MAYVFTAVKQKPLTSTNDLLRLFEPIAFFGGVFAGLLRLDLNEEPLWEWVARTSEAAGLDLSESPSADDDDSIPEDIQID
ncbi:unnamed protein product [Sphagnum balticum]